VDAARAEGADYVYVMGHMGMETTCEPWTYADVIEHTSGIDVFLDGHSHDTEQVVMKNKEGGSVVRSACGTKLACIGYSLVSPTDGVVETGIWSWTNPACAAETLGVRNEVGEKVDAAMTALSEQLDQVVARSSVLLTPYGNQLCVLNVTGQQILDALEWGCRNLPGESAAFMHVSGLCYEADASVPSGCIADENGMFVQIVGTRRVRNVTVGGEPLDSKRIYSLAGVDYILLDEGDGFSMFSDAEVLLDRVKLDNQLLIDYIVETLGGEIGEGYTEPTGEGRIRIASEEAKTARRDASEDLLLVVDFQNVCLPGYDWECPGMPEAMKNTIKLLNASNAPDYLLTRYIAPSEPVGRWVQYNEAYREINENPFLAELPEKLKPFAAEGKVVDKSTYSAMKSEQVLAALEGKKAVVLTGVTAECSVLATMMDAIDMGYEVVYLYDCVARQSAEVDANVLGLAELYMPIHTTIMSSEEYLSAISSK